MSTKDGPYLISFQYAAANSRAEIKKVMTFTNLEGFFTYVAHQASVHSPQLVIYSITPISQQVAERIEDYAPRY